MSTDQLDPRITRRFFLPEKGAVGFGLDFAVRTAQPRSAAENRGTIGEFFWDGAETTLFWVDPINDMAVVFYAQVTPYDGTLHHDIRAAVYGRDYVGAAGD
jgi:CubicO group peptidase (beta-lactamase class C family)